MTRSALLPQSEIARNRAEVLAWLDKEGLTAPDSQWRAILEVIRHFRPVCRDGYVHAGVNYPALKDGASRANRVTLHEVLE